MFHLFIDELCLTLKSLIERLALRTLEKDYTKTEDDLKAVQSVGQIVAEILKQLDDERCKHLVGYSMMTLTMFSSHRQGFFWASICCLLQTCTSPSQTQGWHARFS